MLLSQHHILSAKQPALNLEGGIMISIRQLLLLLLLLRL
jgi:hypothetical protein